MSEAKVALLVGAGDAIGAAVAKRFAQGGFTVCVARRDAAKSDQLGEELKKAGCDFHAFSVDARSSAAVCEGRTGGRTDRGMPLQCRIEREQADS